jgi:hypothetical protein
MGDRTGVEAGLRSTLAALIDKVQEWVDAVDLDTSWDGWDHHFKEMKYTVLPNARAFVASHYERKSLPAPQPDPVVEAMAADEVEFVAQALASARGTPWEILSPDALWEDIGYTRAHFRADAEAAIQALANYRARLPGQGADGKSERGAN